MNNQQFLIDFLTGAIPMKEFLRVFLKNTSFQSFIDSLLPNEAKGNPDHPKWKKFSYDSMKARDFSICNEVFHFCKFDDSPGDNINIFGIIKYFSSHSLQNLRFTTQYYDDCSLYLDVVQDCFEGPEVQELVNAIIINNRQIKTKSVRKKTAKEQIRNLFHVDDPKQRPRWIQGPEWPMGHNSPMKFIQQKRKNESVLYYFRDVDTDDIRIVEQYY